MMAMVEDFAYAATCALGDFACALRGTDAHILAGDCCAFANIAGCGAGVKGDEIACPFANAPGCRAGSFGGTLADVAGSAANITAGAPRLGLGGVWGWGGCGLGGDALAADGDGEDNERDQ